MDVISPPHRTQFPVGEESRRRHGAQARLDHSDIMVLDSEQAPAPPQAGEEQARQSRSTTRADEKALRETVAVSKIILYRNREGT